MKINIIKHRCNSAESVDCRYGAEVDVWSWTDGFGVYLKAAHDCPDEDNTDLDQVLENEAKVFALNAKSTNLTRLIDYVKGRQDYFVFDLPFPEAKRLMDLGIQCFDRVSEYEDGIDAPWMGVWVDQFNKDWVTEAKLDGLLSEYGAVAIVSPELHGRDYKAFWKRLKEMKLEDEIYLCTKHPEEAEAYFSVPVRKS